MDLSYECIADRMRNMMQFGIDLSVEMGNLICFFSLVKIELLIIKVIIRIREKDVFIEANKWLSEKTRLPLKLTDRRFQSAARPQNETAKWVPRDAGELRRFHSAATDRRSNRRMDLTRTGRHRRFHSAVGNRQSEP